MKWSKIMLSHMDEQIKYTQLLQRNGHWLKHHTTEAGIRR